MTSEAARIAAPAPLGPVLRSFSLDLVLTVVAVLLLSLPAAMAWGVIRVVQVAMRGEVDLQDADALMRAIGQPDGTAALWITLLGTGGAALAVYLWRRRASRAERISSHVAIRLPATWGWIVLVATTVFVLSNGLAMLGEAAGFAPEPSNLAPIENAMASRPWFVAVFVVLLAPAYEELLFRRVLFGRLWAAGRPWLGIVLSSAAFAFMHEMPGLSPNSAPATALLWLTYGGMGAAFAWLYRRTGTLWAPIAAHALNNGTALLLLQLSA